MRWVATDKNESLRTAQTPLPVEAKERLVVQGFAERNLGAFRSDAPTSSLLAQNLVAVSVEELSIERTAQQDRDARSLCEMNPCTPTCTDEQRYQRWDQEERDAEAVHHQTDAHARAIEPDHALAP